VDDARSFDRRRGVAPQPVEVEVPAGDPAQSSSRHAASDRVPRHLRAHGRAGGIRDRLVVFNSLVMPRLIHGSRRRQVPDLTHLTLDQAEQALRPLGLQLSRAGRALRPVGAARLRAAQDPDAGTRCAADKRISVMVSLGEEFSSVPSCPANRMRSARAPDRARGLRFGTTVQRPSDDVGEGLVVGSRSAGAETVLPRGHPVSICCVVRSREESFVMPDLLGREIAACGRQLERSASSSRAAGPRPRWERVCQEPAAGSRSRTRRRSCSAAAA
jgi:hypothetical protein